MSDRLENQLCKDCQLCCRGAVCKVLVADEEVPLFPTAKFAERRFADGRQFFTHPCPHIADKGCQIYDKRPRDCQEFTCKTLSRLSQGRISFEIASKTVTDLKADIGKLMADLGLEGRGDLSFQQMVTAWIAQKKHKTHPVKIWEFLSILKRLDQDVFDQSGYIRVLQSSVIDSAGAAHGQEFGSLELKVPDVASSKMLAAWVKALDPDLPPLAAREANNRQKSPAYAWASTVLDLVVSFAQALGMPIFERIEVVGFKGVSNSKDVFRVTLRLPAQDLVPTELLEQMLKLGVAVASWTLGKSPKNPNQLQQFFQIVQNNVRAPFSDKMTHGKSTFHILRAAHNMGIPYFHLPNGVFQLGLGANARRIHRSTTDRDSALGAAWSKNKFSSVKLLRQAGLPAPEHREVSTFEEAKEVADGFGYPVVIKPTDLERGEGVSVDVDASTLKIAFEHACRCSPSNRVLVERQIEGTCHRLFVAEGKLLYAVKRLPIGVYADGLSTVTALVEKEYNTQLKMPPWKRSGIQLLDDLAHKTLNAGGLTPESIPEVGTFVPLRRIETIAWGGVDEDVTNSIHSDNVQLGFIAADLFGMGVAGVDVMSSDITQPWHINGAAINEINFAPLLEGDELSNRHRGEYIKHILVNQGRIPTHVYDESPNSVKQARAHWNDLRSTGLNTFLVSQNELLDGAAIQQHLCAPDLEARVRALVLRQDVQGIVVIAGNTKQAMRLKKVLGTVETK